MKKIFTLAAVALFAMGANAQTETWRAVDDEGNINAVLGNATDGWTKDVTINNDNVTMRWLNNAWPDATTTPNLTSDNWDKFQDAKYSTQNIMVDQYDADGKQIGKKFFGVCGTGIPCVKFIGEAQMKDGDPVVDENGKQLYYVPQRESDGTTGGYVYYVPDGSLGAPTVGPFVQFTAKVAGQLKIGFWANKGGGRALYIVDNETGKALSPFGDAPEYHAEGWVQNYRVKNVDPTSTDNSFAYLNPMPIDSSYTINANPSEAAKYNGFNFNGQRKVGYLVFNAVANKTYTVMGNNWQIAIQGYEFTPGGTNGIETINNVKFDKNAPVYNLAGQRVNKSFRGVVIQNGRKFIQ